MEKGGAVYIMTNALKSVLYTGVTSDLITRVQQHKSKYYADSFTAKYNVTILVYYECYTTIREAILEEKRIKGGSRLKKMKLINAKNPMWEDLWIKALSKW